MWLILSVICSHAYLGVDHTNLFICYLYFLFSPVNQWNHIICWMLIIYLVKLWCGMVEIRCYPGVMCIFSNVTGYHSMYHVYQSTHEFEHKLKCKLKYESKFKLSKEKISLYSSPTLNSLLQSTPTVSYNLALCI